MADQLERLTAALADRYAIEHELGQGGMATVYLAEDIRHDRKVAVKVLRAELAAVLGAERFVQEIKTTASLQHPHILPLFDSGEAGGFLYYVMPYIEGETLRDKLNRETQLGIDEAVQIAIEVLDALDYAHRHNVIHRDIKPENILLHDGRPMVADFGIALAVSAAAGGRMTETGLSLGTPHYMSPEQATAEKDLTNRSDIYSVGAMLYEMLTGDPPHTGSTAQQVIMKIVTEEAAPVTSARKSVPANIAAAVATALEKLPADRFATAEAMAGALRDPTFVLASAARVAAAALAVPIPFHRRPAAAWIVAMIAVLVGGLALWGPWRGDASSARVHRFVLHLPEGDTLVGSSPIALSRDGSELVYAARRAGTGRLYRWRLDQFEPEPIDGTEGARQPFYSADGRWIGFTADGWLNKVALIGGSTAPILELQNFFGATWEPNDTIIFGGRIDGISGIWEVPAAGGTPEQIKRAGRFGDVPDQVNWSPQVLPGGDALLFGVRHAAQSQRIDVYQLGSGERRTILEPGNRAWYAPTGDLVYWWNGDLLAADFDVRGLRTTASGAPVVAGVYVDAYALSEAGVLAYASGARQVPLLVWVDARGAVEPAQVRAGETTLRISPDGARVILMRSVNRSVIWIYDLQRGEGRPLTDPESDAFWAIWSSDGHQVFYNSSQDGPHLNLYAASVDGSSDVQRITTEPHHQQPYSTSADGTVLGLQRSDHPATGSDIFTLALDTDSTPRAFLATRAMEVHPALSRDGQWMAYASDEPGRYAVYVRSLAGGGETIVVSSGGRWEPLWAPDGETLYYRDLSGDSLFMVPFESQPLRIGEQRVVVTGDFLPGTPWGRTYDIHPSGDRFLLRRAGEPSGALTRIHVVLNWFNELGAKRGDGE
jgi:serine/threonine-protein kinase